MAFLELSSGPLAGVASSVLSKNTNSSRNADESNKSRVLTAQFPASRADSLDNDQDTKALYRNGLLFTAIDFSKRGVSDLTSFRKNNLGTVSNATNITKDAIALLLLPRGQTDVDNITHKFNDVQQSLQERGGGSVSGALSSLASHTVYGAIESMTRGAFADSNEQLYVASRSLYAGADNRSKSYVWHLTPRNTADLSAILVIYETFRRLSYGNVVKSATAKKIADEIISAYKRSLSSIVPTGANLDGTNVETAARFLSNATVVTNPTVWMVRNFGASSSYDMYTDTFGPCQIQNIRLDKAPDGVFGGLNVAPNLPSSFVLEVTFREIMPLDRTNEGTYV